MTDYEIAYQWLQEFYEIPQDRRTWRIDTIYDTLDDWLIGGHTHRIECVLQSIDLTKITGAEILSVLIVSRLGHEGKCIGSGILHTMPIPKINGYPEFYQRVDDYWKEIGKADRAECLHGLAPK